MSEITVTLSRTDALSAVTALTREATRLRDEAASIRYAGHRYIPVRDSLRDTASRYAYVARQIHRQILATTPTTSDR